MNVWDKDTVSCFLAGQYSRETGGSWAIETMLAPKPDPDEYTQEVFKGLQRAKLKREKMNNASFAPTVVTIM
jgi:hypothetical protein